MLKRIKINIHGIQISSMIKTMKPINNGIIFLYRLENTSLKLSIGGTKSTKISPQLTYSLVKCPIGIMEDVQIRIWHLIIPTNFVVMDIQEDYTIPILLVKPFLVITRKIVDVNLK